MSDIEGGPAISEPVGFLQGILTPARTPRVVPEFYATARIGTVPSSLR